MQAALDSPAPPLLVDLREPWERKVALIPGEELHLPFSQFEERRGELPRQRELLLYWYASRSCQSAPPQRRVIESMAGVSRGKSTCTSSICPASEIIEKW